MLGYDGNCIKFYNLVKKDAASFLGKGGYGSVYKV